MNPSTGHASQNVAGMQLQIHQQQQQQQQHIMQQQGIMQRATGYNQLPAGQLNPPASSGDGSGGVDIMSGRMAGPNIPKPAPPSNLTQPSATGSQMHHQQQLQQQQQQQQKEMNTASLCRLGQETVQEIVNKTTELFQHLKQVQLPNGTQQSLNVQKERKEKIQEHLHNIGLLFKRLRLIYDKCNENCAGMEYTHIESLIPLKDEVDSRPEERKLTETMKFASEEHREIAEQVILRSKHLKEIIDHLRSIIWEVNTMLSTRKP